jgi:hypothetical protein
MLKARPCVLRKASSDTSRYPRFGVTDLRPWKSHHFREFASASTNQYSVGFKEGRLGKKLSGGSTRRLIKLRTNTRTSNPITIKTASSILRSNVKNILTIKMVSLPKHDKYEKSYKPSERYWGLGIENESYIEF